MLTISFENSHAMQILNLLITVCKWNLRPLEVKFAYGNFALREQQRYSLWVVLSGRSESHINKRARKNFTEQSLFANPVASISGGKFPIYYVRKKLGRQDCDLIAFNFRLQKQAVTSLGEYFSSVLE
ncbi:hypothetical protein T07_5771 [Trichinella nelsoni]|uniref:Uncharacterized protein n=1 Tax=Trichinella nelsoni TaxID=6336 RepID=A0A0V0S3G4_9BILA|nr:hypothetical protein T07_5771 [Trichinella nelsoni]